MKLLGFSFAILVLVVLMCEDGSAAPAEAIPMMKLLPRQVEKGLRMSRAIPQSPDEPKEALEGSESAYYPYYYYPYYYGWHYPVVYVG